MKLDHKKPDTERFCTICNKITKWHYDWGIGHSRCVICNSTSKYAKNRNYDPKYLKEKQRIKKERKNGLQEYVKKIIKSEEDKSTKELFRYLKFIETKPWLMKWG